MTDRWRISTVNGLLLACYFVPAWTLVAFKTMISPMHGLFDRPNVAVAIFMSDHLHYAGTASVRIAWLLALGKLTTVTFFAVFAVFTTRPAVRRTGGCDEALAMALIIGGTISLASLAMASRVGEVAALHLHASELLLMVGAAVLWAIEPSRDTEAPSTSVSGAAHAPSPSS